MYDQGHPALAKKLNEKIPKTVDEVFERVRAFIRGERAADTTDIARAPYWDKERTKQSGLVVKASLEIKIKKLERTRTKHGELCSLCKERCVHSFDQNSEGDTGYG